MNVMMEHALQSFRKFNGFMPSSRHTEIFDIVDENGEQIIIIEVRIFVNHSMESKDT